MKKNKQQKYLDSIGFQGELLPELWPLAAQMKSTGLKSRDFPMILATLNEQQRELNLIGLKIKMVDRELDRSQRMKSNGRY